MTTECPCGIDKETRTYHRTLESFFRSEAGRRAIEWFLDNGDCLFCNVDNNNGDHEDHCTFFGKASEELERVYKDEC